MDTRDVRSKDLIEIAGVGDFWERVDAATAVVLMLDYDGTLAPFHVDRMQARPLPHVTEALRRIASDSSTSVVIVSGRPVAEILSLLGDLSLSIAGSHGYEWYRPDSGLVPMPVTEQQSTILDTALAQATRIFDTERIERKVASVAVHFRGLQLAEYVDVERELSRDWQSMSESGDTELRPFNGGLELRAVGRSKGAVVTETLADSPSDALSIYIGDDDTDEDAFAALPRSGIGVKVGPADVDTLATGRLPDCAAVERLLIDWSMRRERR